MLVQLLSKSLKKGRYVKNLKLSWQDCYLPSHAYICDFGDICLSDYIEWNECKFIYNKYQKRLYLISLSHLCYEYHLFYINNPHKKVNNNNNNKRWIKCKLNVNHNKNKIFDKMGTLKTLTCLLLFDTLLMIENTFNILWIDLLTMNIYKTEKQIHAINVRKRYILNSYDNYIHIINYDKLNCCWYKINLLDIIPNKLFNYYRNNLFDKLIIGYIKEIEIEYKFKFKFPQFISKLILFYFPIFFYLN